MPRLFGAFFVLCFLTVYLFSLNCSLHTTKPELHLKRFFNVFRFDKSKIYNKEKGRPIGTAFFFTMPLSCYLFCSNLSLQATGSELQLEIFSMSSDLMYPI